MTDEAAFLAGIRAEPKDDLRRLVFADWLEEQPDDLYRAKAEYLRLEVHVSGLPDDHPERDGFILKLREVAEGLPIEWKTAVAKVPIENCNVRWRFQCPKKWSELEETRSPDVRFCTACRKDVTYCNSVEEARRIAEEVGACVAIDLGVIRRDRDMNMLRNPPELETEQMDGMLMGGDFNPGAPWFTPPPPANPGLLRRLWRKLTGK
jgi:uncharacterized protein (TIGR02996 family)